MSDNDSGSNILIFIVYIYMIISQISALYFWWQFAQHNSFWSSLLLGPFVAEFKGLLWIFFIW